MMLESLPIPLTESKIFGKDVLVLGQNLTMNQGDLFGHFFQKKLVFVFMGLLSNFQWHVLTQIKSEYPPIPWIPMYITRRQ